MWWKLSFATTQVGKIPVWNMKKKPKRKSMPYRPCHQFFNPVRQHILSTARLCFSCLWQVAKVEIREVVRQVPKVEVFRLVDDVSLSFCCHGRFRWNMWKRRSPSRSSNMLLGLAIFVQKLLHLWTFISVGWIRIIHIPITSQLFS